MITAYFEEGITTVNVSGIWQWDYGQTLAVEGLKLPAVVEAHFSLTETGTDAINRIGTTRNDTTIFSIPDKLLENDGITDDYYIFVHLYYRDRLKGETIRKIRMQVRSRPAPDSFETPEEKELFADAVVAVRESAEEADESVRKAEAWAHGHRHFPNTLEDNAKYYAEMARQVAIKNGFFHLSINEGGELEMVRENLSSLNIVLNDAGELEVEINE